MTKAKYPKTKIRDTIDFLEDLEALKFIYVISVRDVRKLALNLIYQLNLYASDAIILATAIKKKADLITDDKHILKKSVRDYANKKGVRIMTLKEFFQQHKNINLENQ